MDTSNAVKFAQYGLKLKSVTLESNALQSAFCLSARIVTSYRTRALELAYYTLFYIMCKTTSILQHFNIAYFSNPKRS